MDPNILSIDQVPDAVVVVGESGEILAANAKALALFQYSEGELIGSEVETLVPDSVAQGHKTFRTIRSARGAARDMGRVQGIKGKRRDGVELSIDAHLSYDQNGRLIFVFVRERALTNGSKF